jgi:enolase
MTPLSSLPCGPPKFWIRVASPHSKVTVTLSNGIEASAAVPSGASTGQFEAIELRDGDVKRYGEKRVLKAIHNVETVLSRAVAGLQADEQRLIDRAMIDADGTEYKAD